MKNQILFFIFFILFTFYLFINQEKEFFSNQKEIEERINRGGNIASSRYDYPTANINNSANLPCGIYTADSNYGECVCMVLSPFRIECHIKNFKENIYGKNLKLKNIKKIDEMHDYFATLINSACKKIKF